MINCDNRSEFTSREFNRLVKDRGIDVRCVDIGDHTKLGIVDRFIRTLREKINKYMTMYNTTKYINVLPQILHGYNNTYQSGIHKKSIQVEENDKEVIELTRKKYVKAKREETKYNIGDAVRHILNKKQFDKGTLPKFSKMVHKIISNTEHTYTLDNGKTYNYYELQLELVKQNEHVTRATKEPTREEMKKQRTSARRFNMEDKL